MKRAMIGSRAFVLDKDKADEFLRQKSDKKAIERIYRNADKFEKNNTNHIYSKGYNKAIDDFEKCLLSNEVIDKSVIRRIAEQLKSKTEL